MSEPMIDVVIRRAEDNAAHMMTRVYRFLRDDGPQHRDKIMHWCGFRSPRQDPIIAYVEFTLTVMRLDTILRRHRMCIVGGLETNEVYKLVGWPA